MYSEAVIYKMLLDTKGRPPFPTIADRAEWEAVRSHPKVEMCLSEAERVAAEPVPALPATLYLDCNRTGNRRRFEAGCGQPRD